MEVGGQFGGPASERRNVQQLLDGFDHVGCWVLAAKVVGHAEVVQRNGVEQVLTVDRQEELWSAGGGGRRGRSSARPGGTTAPHRANASSGRGEPIVDGQPGGPKAGFNPSSAPRTNTSADQLRPRRERAGPVRCWSRRRQ